MLLRVLAGLLVILLLLAAYHHLRLAWEAGRITPVGQRVTVDGYHMNVYTQGQKRSGDSPTVVLLSGSGMTAPIYEYKVLYAPLSASYRVAVIEKFGYGYADDSPLARDVATMVEEDRAALAAAGEQAPYVLMPHSMSALEAIYWAHTYPGEIAGIIGLDMAV
ncbi:MAG: alpha/beta hydrolase, partial [Gemmiger sp.]|nr:alpha/beta hydrolase [Gemmiger sp.]